MKCPVCKKEVELSAPEMPFCSERCRLIDLGMWANEEYRIPAVDPPRPPDVPAEPEPEESGE